MGTMIRSSVHTDLGYPCDGDGHSVAGVDFIALHIQSQSVQGNPVRGKGAQREKNKIKCID